MPLSILTNPVVCKKCNQERIRFINSKMETCTSCYKKNYYRNNSEKIRLQNDKWKIQNLSKVKEIQRNYKEKKKVINICPSCNRDCYKTKQFIETNMCRECFEAKEKKRKYDERVRRKAEYKRPPYVVSKEKAHEYYLNYYYGKRDEILERRRSKTFLIRKDDQNDFQYYMEREKLDFQKIWETEKGNLLEDVQKKVYRDLKKNNEFKKSNTTKRKVRFTTTATLHKSIKDGKSFEYSLLKDMKSFQDQLIIYGLKDSLLFNKAVGELLSQKIQNDKEKKRNYSKTFRKKYPEKVKENTKNWLLRHKENVGIEEYKRVQNENQKKYYSKVMAENPEKLRELARRSYRKNREKILEKQKLRYANRKNMSDLQNTKNCI